MNSGSTMNHFSRSFLRWLHIKMILTVIATLAMLVFTTALKVILDISKLTNILWCGFLASCETRLTMTVQIHWWSTKHQCQGFSLQIIYQSSLKISRVQNLFWFYLDNHRGFKGPFHSRSYLNHPLPIISREPGVPPLATLQRMFPTESNLDELDLQLLLAKVEIAVTSHNLFFCWQNRNHIVALA